MADDDFSHLAELHQLGDTPIPNVVTELAGSGSPELVWRNDLGGLTFQLGDRFIKWNPASTGIDLHREKVRLEWLADKHPAPQPLAFGSDGNAQWLLTAAVPGVLAVGDLWRARRSEALAAIATGLKAIHSLPVDDFPEEWVGDSWVARRPESLGSRPKISEMVVVHGDACAPNTLVSLEGEWTGHVDFGDLGLGDRWADLAVASLSLDWNFGEGHQEEFFAAYGVELDPERIAYYRSLWDLES